MSIAVMGKILRESKLPEGERFALLVLADFGNDDGVGIYASHKTIAARMNVNDRTLRRRLNNLKKCGVLSWNYKSHAHKGGIETNDYVIDVSKIGYEDISRLEKTTEMSEGVRARLSAPPRTGLSEKPLVEPLDKYIHASACEDVSISTIPQPIPEQQISRTYAMEHGTSHDAFLLPSQKPNQRLVANAKGTTETERAMVLKFCELTGITLTKRTLATNISAAKDILASNATVDDIVSAWDESNRGVKWPVTSLFSLRGAAARLAGMRAIQSARVVVADSDMVYTPSGRMVKRND